MAILDEIDSGEGRLIVCGAAATVLLPEFRSSITRRLCAMHLTCNASAMHTAAGPVQQQHLACRAGLDIDALRDVSKAVNGLKAQRPDMGILMVTHYKVRRRQHP